MSIVTEFFQKKVNPFNSSNADVANIAKQQIQVLRNLLKVAKNTRFGNRFDFEDMIRLKDPRNEFRNWIPVYDYDKMYKEWWHLAKKDQADISWPGIIPYYGVSSGSTQAASKHIPITHESLHSWNRISRQIFKAMISSYHIHPSLFTKHSLMVGGTSNLIQEGKHLWGDCSGIMAKNRPGWLKNLYKPESEVLELNEWTDRLDNIVERATSYDIAFMVGNIAWIQKILERIVDKYKLDHIHQVWPNLTMILHSGVFITPYQNSIESLFGKPVHYMDIYSATEGIIAYQHEAHEPWMQMILNENMYYEYIPFDDQHFDEDGKLRTEFPEVKTYDEVQEGVSYALLISTTSGAWHYSIGDVIQFVDKTKGKIQLMSRTKDQISLTGEHLTLDNISQCIQFINSAFDLEIKEFSVAGVKEKNVVCHHWYLGTNDKIDIQRLKMSIDDFLRISNDDYAVQRKSLVKDLVVHTIPESLFFEWLAKKGKLNGQAKTPKIIKSEHVEDWNNFLMSNNIPLS